MMHAVEFQQTFACNALHSDVKLGQRIAYIRVRKQNVATSISYMRVRSLYLFSNLISSLVSSSLCVLGGFPEIKFH